MSEIKKGDKVVYKKASNLVLYHVSEVNGNGSLDLQGPRRARPGIDPDRIRHATPAEIRRWKRPY